MRMSLGVCCDGGAICWSGCRRGDMIVLRGFAQITRGFEYQTDWFLHTGEQEDYSQQMVGGGGG